MLTKKEERLKRFQETRKIAVQILQGYQAKQDALLKPTDVPIFDASEVMKGLGLSIFNNKTVPFQFVDIQQRKVVQFKSRRELEDHIGELSDEDYKRYEEQDSILILKDEKTVKFEQPFGFR